MTFTPAKWPRDLRSRKWFAGTHKDAIYHRGWMKNQGLPADLFDGRPVIGILNTWSELTPCNAHLRDLAEKVKFGIYEAGGFPVEVPVFSASESAFRPTAMMFRNLAAMAVEEAMRGQPMDGCVLLVGCDKTTPSLLMAAASTDIPSICVTGGPMLNGYFRNERVGSGTHLWKFSEAVKAGEMTAEEFVEAEASMSRSPGSCNTMGTASTMASMAEALGMETTAEGAETQDEIELIKRLGCSHIQGFYYGPPLEVRELIEKMGLDGSAANRVGPKTSRAPRLSVLRRAELVIDGHAVPVRLRNISESGTMIELKAFLDPGSMGQLLIQDGPTLDVRCVWWADQKCGLTFNDVVDLKWLANGTAQRSVAA